MRTDAEGGLSEEGAGSERRVFSQGKEEDTGLSTIRSSGSDQVSLEGVLMRNEATRGKKSFVSEQMCFAEWSFHLHGDFSPVVAMLENYNPYVAPTSFPY